MDTAGKRTPLLSRPPTADAMHRALSRRGRSICDFTGSLAVIRIVITIEVGVVLTVVDYAWICHRRRLWGFTVVLAVSWMVSVIVMAVVVVVVNYKGICQGRTLWDFTVGLTDIWRWTQIACARLKALSFQDRAICDIAVCLARISMLTMLTSARPSSRDPMNMSYLSSQ